MCILCEGNYNPLEIIKLDYCCYVVTEIPDTLTNLTHLECEDTQVTQIPLSLIHI